MMVIFGDLMRFLRPSNPMLIKGPARVLGLYLLFSTAWIVITDFFCRNLMGSSVAWHTVKGLVYVATSGIILFWLCRGLVLDANRLERTVAELFSQSEFGVLLGSEQGVLVDCNEAFATMLGFTVDELIGRDLRELVHKEDVAAALGDWSDRNNQQLSGKYVKQLRYVHRDGRTVWVRLAMSQIKSEKKDLRLIVGLSQDVSVEVEGFHALERQRTELAKMLDSVRRSESRFKHVLESLHTGIMLANSTGHITEVNSAFLAMLGYSQEDLRNGSLRWDTITPTEYAKSDKTMLDILRRTGRMPSYEKLFIRKDGTEIPVLLGASKISEETDGHFESVASVVDLRDIKQKDAELSRLARAVDCAFEGIVITDTDSRIMYANEAFERMTGFSRLELVGRTPAVLKSGRTSPEEYEALWKTLNRGETWQGRFWNRRKDGTQYLEDATITPVKDNGGKVINYLAVKRDITREFQLEQRLIQSQKLEAVGQLTGGVAHDLNNVLQVIHSSAELAVRRNGEATYMEKKLRDIITSSKRGAGIIRQLLMFSRGETPSPKLVELNDVIRETGTMLKRLLPENVEIILELDHGLTSIEADPVRLSQVLLNLAVNARDAMPHGGVLVVGTRRVEQEERKYVRLTVSDTGMGMDDITKEKIFEPFFTTKEAGKGTGLGLTTVMEIAEQCRARLSVESEPGRGTSFYLDFPAVDDRICAASSQMKVEDAVKLPHSGAVLVCEDDESVRSAISEYLELAGAEVIRCSNAGEAKAAITKQRPAVLIADLIMPGKSGVELGRELQQEITELKVLLITGHTEHELLREAQVENGFQILQKPFSATTLLQRLSSLMTIYDA